LQLLTGGFAQRTADPVVAHQQAVSLLDRIVNGQAMLLSFADVFFYVAAAFIVTLPLLFFLGKGGAGEAAPDAH
jgi:DHA2 family multidrug resistance protein